MTTIADIAKQYRAGLLDQAELAKLKPEDARAIVCDTEGARRSILIDERLTQAIKPDRTNQNLIRGVLISSDRVNRGGTIILSKGADVSNFKKNPRLLFGHDDFSAEGNIGWVRAVAKETRSKLGDVLVADEEYFSEELNPKAQFVLRLVLAGGYPARSTGILPTDDGIVFPQSEDERKKLGLGPYGVVIAKYELLEESVVTLPKQADAVTNALRERVEGVWKQELKDAPSEVRSWVESNLAPTEEELERIERHRAKGFAAFPVVPDVPEREVLFQHVEQSEPVAPAAPVATLEVTTSPELHDLTAELRGTNARLGELVELISNAMQDGEAGEAPASTSKPGSEPGAKRAGRNNTDFYRGLMAAVDNRLGTR